MNRHNNIIVVSLQEVIDNIYKLLLHTRVGQMSMSRVDVEVRMREKYNQYFSGDTQKPSHNPLLAKERI